MTGQRAFAIIAVAVMVVSAGMVAASGGFLVDSFEDGDLSEYKKYEADGNEAKTSTDTAFDGSVSLLLEDPSDNGGNPGVFSTSGLPGYPNRGDTFAARVNATIQPGDPGSPERASLYFGSQSTAYAPNGYEAEIKWDTDTLLLKKHNASGTYTLNSTSPGVGFDTKEFLKINVQWKTNITLTLINGSGTTLATTWAKDTQYSSGGIGFTGQTLDSQSNSYGQQYYWDYLNVTASNGSVSGYVRDTRDNALNNATVTVKDNGTVITSDTTNKTGQYELSAPDGNYTFQVTKRGYTGISQTREVNGTTVHNFTLAASASPYVADLRSLTTIGLSDLQRNDYTRYRRVTLWAEVVDPDTPTLNATLYFYNRTTQTFEVANQTTLQSGDRISATVDSYPGVNRWRVTATDGVSNGSAVGLGYLAAGTLQIYNATDGKLVTDETVKATVSSTSSNYQDTKTTTNGNISLNGAPLEELRVKVGAKTYVNVSAIISDPSFRQSGYGSLVLAEDTGASGSSSAAPSTVNQQFELKDQTGNYPPSETDLIIEYYLNGQWQTYATGRFGPGNSVSAELINNQDYRLVIKNDNRVSSLGTLAFVDSNFPDPIVLTVSSSTGGISTNVSTGGTSTNVTNNPPVARIDWSPSAPVDGNGVTFDATQSSDSDGQIVAYYWDFTNNGTYKAGTSLDSYTFSSPGSKTVGLRVQDDDGLNDTVHVDLYVGNNSSDANTKPNASYTISPSDPAPGQTITLNASGSSDPDGTISSYRWDIDNDGVYELSGVNVTTSYQAAGTKQITLNVTDNESTSDLAIREIVISSGGEDQVANRGYSWDAFFTDQDDIRFEFVAASDTDVRDLTLYLWPRGNKSAIREVGFGVVRSVSHLEPLTQNESDKVWVVKWNATVDGQQQSGRTLLGGTTPAGTQIPSFWREVAAIAIIIVSAFVFGGLLSNLGVVVIPLEGLVFWQIGWLPAEISAVTLVAALAIGAVTYIRSRPTQGVPG